MAASDALASLFKAYDVRGIVPDQLDETVAFAIGAGFAQFCAETDSSQAVEIVIGRDMRASGPGLAAAFIAGAARYGAAVTDVGLCSTDLLYFASGRLDRPGAMLTASHNPAAYNGIKFCLSGARPIGEESGLLDIRAYAEKVLASPPAAPFEAPEVTHIDLLEEFAAHVRSFVDIETLSGLSVVADAANGMGGLIAPRVFAPLDVRFELLYGELDGTFPNHPADPIQPENLVDLQRAILEGGFDAGLAFDGDADRVFLVDEKGQPLSGSTTTAIVAAAMLKRHAGATILYNCICSKSVREVIAELGGIGVRTRVGHSFIKAVMAATGALFGGEHSGHYYFADNYRADSGSIAALVVLEALAASGKKLSELRLDYERYADSGEINSHVVSAPTVLAAVEDHFLAAGAEIDHLDGLTVDSASWWFNLRPSNTEPLLRLNVEAADQAQLDEKVAQMLDMISASDAR